VPTSESRIDTSFGRRLHDAIAINGRLCVGIDPAVGVLQAWGLDDTPQGARTFSLRMLDASSGSVPIVKPQSAYYERFGAAGAAVLEDVCREAGHRGLLVLLDAKRGDIGSTNRAYAEAYLSSTSPTKVDAMTVTPYVGVDALEPLFSAAVDNDCGLFVLARTSNPEGAGIQRGVVREVLKNLAVRNARFDYGPFGCVFGATITDSLELLDGTNAFVLAPGLGSQGASPEDLANRFTAVRSHVLPSASRSIAAFGPDGSTLTSGIERLRDECTRLLAAQ
jgi:orotidine-5'-phosphate decarboxylase